MPQTKPKSLEELLVTELRDMYDAEKQLIKALGKLARGAEDEELQAAFTDHLEQTRRQAERLEEVFGLLGLQPRGKHCPGMAGIIEEGNEAISELPKSPSRDAALVAGAQRAEHYEMAAYRTLVTLARTLGQEEAAEIFESILAEEQETDEKLTALAESINAAVVEQEGEATER